MVILNRRFNRFNLLSVTNDAESSLFNDFYMSNETQLFLVCARKRK